MGFYLPFGKAWAYPATIVNNFRFPGQYYDAETGLHYNWHRYYDPDTGRYITADPIGLEGGMNLYAYVMGNPVKGIDPWGFENCLPNSQNGVFYKNGNPSGEVGIEADPLLDPAMLMGIGACIAKIASRSGIKGTYMILDGVRRSKAAELVGKKTIEAEVDIGGKTVRKIKVTIESLRSPKSSIDISTNRNMDRFMETLNSTKSGSKPPPIRITPGSKGTSIKDVNLDPIGE